MTWSKNLLLIIFLSSTVPVAMCQKRGISEVSDSDSGEEDVSRARVFVPGGVEAPTAAPSHTGGSARGRGVGANAGAGGVTVARELLNKDLFFEAARSGNSQFLLEYMFLDMHPDVRDSSGCTALMLAAENGHDLSVKVLLDAGADVTLTDQEEITAFGKASRNNHIDCCSLLFTHGASVTSDVDVAVLARMYHAFDSREYIARALSKR